MAGWDAGEPGVLTLPSGRRVRGRSLRASASATTPDFGVYLRRRPPGGIGWDHRWVRWADFDTPADPVAARAALVEAWERTVSERVEVACPGGRGRTGTALACLVVLDGVPADDAVAYVRRGFHPRAVETPGQRRFVRWCGAG